jgi:serine/threonine protein kinase/formylglycine-generating enzyme required for sulfatase activity
MAAIMSGHTVLPIQLARQIDRLCLQFEQAWRSDGRPALEQFLEEWDGPAECRSNCFEELLRVELEALERASIYPSIHQYIARFPDYRDTIRSVFTELSAEGISRSLTATFVTQQKGPGGSLPVQIGRYLIQRELGRGAFGVVYLAQDPQLDCLVAIKQLNQDRIRKSFGSDQVDFGQVIEDVMREARLAARVRQYQGIVAVLDVLTTTEDDTPTDIYFVQEYIDGAPLKELLKQRPVSPVETARILQLVAFAMDHVHRHGIYHRDLKPGNIILDSRGTPCVVDFGLAIDAELQKERRGEISGTLPYMAPEQMRGEAHLLDGRADIWALGVILYEMLVGQRPFLGKSRSDLANEICRRDPIPPRAINPQLPAELERICLKCLSKRMVDRYATADALGEDLRQWLAECEAGPAPVGPEEPACLVPRGLRSFVEEDAEFFPQLLPGPRNRYGLHESIHFWKQRIEEKAADQTFRVGLLYGPSGCGKSSLVRAGLLPRLNQVIPVYIESTVADTEARLLGRLRAAVPQLSQDLSLPEAIMALRESPAWSGFKKVLLIFDQFEQWLQSRSTFGGEQLIEALRQCDGARVQALLLVRDDFWMAVTRLLHELEVDLIPGENIAAVDLFSPAHARHVLTEMGRAYGKLDRSQQPTREQEDFIRRAVAGLSHDGMVICVQLAIFAEMVRDKEWVPRTIDQVGGTQGVGEQFLEDAFTSPGANPQHRMHEHAARQVLQALLPDVSADIRGHMRSRGELLRASGYQDRSRDFDELLRILDCELRLITPTDPAGVERRTDATTGSDAAYYQLTHDFLVPSVRNWLTRRQRATRKGRAELLLSELAELWRLKPDSRRLPSPLEWGSIVWWTKPSERTDSQQQMVRAASRRLARGATLWTLGLFVLGWLAYEANARVRADSIVKSIASAEARELPLHGPALVRYHRWTQGLVERDLASARAEGELRRERRLELALAVLDPSRAGDLLDGLEAVPIEDLHAFIDLLRPHATFFRENLWRRFHAAAVDQESSALKLAAFLAAFAPVDRRWEDEAEWIAHRLVQVRTAEAGHWRELMRPVGTILSPKLIDISASTTSLAANHRTTMHDLIVEYASASPELLARAVESAAPQELPDLLAALETHPDAANYIGKRQTAVKDVPAAPVPGSLGDDVRETIKAAQGLVSASNAFVQSLPRQSFDELDDQLREAQYKATCVRPYLNGDELLVAAVWERDAGAVVIHWDVPLEQIEAIDRGMRERELLPVDFGRYWNSGTSTPEEMRWVVVWSEPRGELAETQLMSAATLSEFARQYNEMKSEYYSIRRFDIWLASDGEPRCSMIWTQGDEIDHGVRADWRYARAHGDLSPGQLQTDVRFEWIAPETRDRIGVFKHLSHFQETANRREICRYQLLMGDLNAAKAILDAPETWQDDPEKFHRYSALLFARSRDREQLVKHINAYSELETARQDVVAYLNLCAAALDGDRARCAEYLQMLERPRTNFAAESLARARALMASLAEHEEVRTMHVDRAVSLLRSLVSQGQAGNPESLIFDVDFDPIRDTGQFSLLLSQLEFRQRFAAAYARSRDHESRQIYGLPPRKHLEEAETLLRRGFHPNVVTLQSDGAGAGLQCASVWHRRVLDVDQRINRAHREANLLLAAARFGDDGGLMEELSTVEQPDARSYLILHAPALLPLDSLKTMLSVADDENVTQALLLMLGAIPLDRIDPAEFGTLVGQVHALMESTHTGVRSAALWCLRQWNAPEPGPSPQKGAEQTDYMNPIGERMLVIAPPDELLMGSPAWESGHAEQEIRHWIRIPRIYSLADTESTRAAYYRFLQDERVRKHFEDERVRRYFGGGLTRFHLNSASASDLRPIVGVSWRDAALFCQWLSEQDTNIDASEYCYPDIWTAHQDDKVALPGDYLHRTGYRLPTEAEWEWAARGGVQSAARSCGDDVRILEGYAWFLDNAGRTTQPVGRLRPNPFGFFDMLGNASEWCDDTYRGYRAPQDGYVRADAVGNDTLPLINQRCARRGGNSNQHHAEQLRSADRTFEFPTYYSPSTGFRVARTMPKP